MSRAPAAHGPAPGRGGRGHRVGDVVRAERVVVVRKTTAIESLGAHPDRKLARAVANRDPLAERVLRAHEEHVRTAAVVEEALRERGVDVRIVSDLGRRQARWADLIVTVGGDGTFLRASHRIDATDGDDGTPMLGVNSATSSSVGYFCAARADDFHEVLDRVLAGQVRSRGLWRLQVTLNDQPLRDLALNDVLVAHRVPAETTRYVLQIGEVRQEQKSSGIWVATAAGSTAAIRSAGGQIVDIEARIVQYRVRELMSWSVSGEPLAGGLVPDGLEVLSRMTTGRLYLDGGHLRVAFGFGDRIRFEPARRPMPWISPASLTEHRPGA